MSIENKSERLSATMIIFWGLVVWYSIFKLYVSFISPHIYKIIPEIYSMIISTMIVPYAIALPILWLIIRRLPINESKNDNKRFTRAEIIKLIIIQSGISILIMIILNVIMTSLGFGEDETAINSIKEYVGFNIFLLLVFNPIFEEIMFRKIILSRLIKWGEKYAILVSAMIFAFPHAFSQGIPSMFYTFFLGCIWGYITINTGDITLAILLHSFSNLWAAFLPMLLFPSKMGMVVYVLIWVILVPSIAIFLLFREGKKKNFNYLKA